MGTYRVYFRDATGIVGRHDLVAADDRQALALANALFDACSDRCSSFEVWRGENIVLTRHIILQSPFGVREIVETHQQAVVEHEDAIQRSKWAIASSKRLLARLAELRSRGHRMAG